MPKRALRRPGAPPILALSLMGLWSVGVGACGCSRREPPPGAGGPQGHPAPAGPTLTALFTSERAAMPAPLAALTFDTRKAEADQVLAGLSKGRVPLPGFEGVSVRIGFNKDDERVRYVRLSLPAAAKAALSDAWGEPTKAKVDTTTEGLYWHNPDGGMQAVLQVRGEGIELTLWPLLPWRRFLGTEKVRLGFETTPLLGMTAGEVLRSYGGYRAQRAREDRIDLRLPPYEFHTGPNTVSLTLTEGRVSRIYFKLHYGNHPPMKADLQAAFEAKFGQPIEADPLYTTYSKRPTIKMGHSEPTAQFSFTIEAG